MPYTQEEGGRLNNFAVEPKVYRAEPPTKAEKRNYLILGTVGLLLISGFVYLAFSVSNIS